MSFARQALLYRQKGLASSFEMVAAKRQESLYLLPWQNWQYAQVVVFFGHPALLTQQAGLFLTLVGTR